MTSQISAEKRDHSVRARASTITIKLITKLCSLPTRQVGVQKHLEILIYIKADCKLSICYNPMHDP